MQRPGGQWGFDVHNEGLTMKAHTLLMLCGSGLLCGINGAQAVTSNGTINATGIISSSSNISASGNITAGSNITATGNVTASKDVLANGTLRSAHDTIIGGIIKLQQVNTAGTSCDTWGSVSRDRAGAILSCQSGVWNKAGQAGLERTTWSIPGARENYGDACEAYIASSGMKAQGWVASGSDACTEDGEYCTTDNVRCYAVRLQ